MPIIQIHITTPPHPLRTDDKLINAYIPPLSGFVSAISNRYFYAAYKYVKGKHTAL